MQVLNVHYFADKLGISADLCITYIEMVRKKIGGTLRNHIYYFFDANSPSKKVVCAEISKRGGKISSSQLMSALNGCQASNLTSV
jgi:hypothetical protein